MKLVAVALLALSACRTPEPPARPKEVPQKTVPHIPSKKPVETWRPAPDPELKLVPDSVVVLAEEPDRFVRIENISFHQNTSADSPNLPFVFLFDTKAFERLVAHLHTQGVYQPVRFVIHWPGWPSGAHTLCERTGIIEVDCGRHIFELVYEPYFKGKNLSDPEVACEFLAMTESVMNYVVFHEAEHLRHCLENTPKDQAEKEAQLVEGPNREAFGQVLYLIPKDGADLGRAMDYVKSFRK